MVKQRSGNQAEPSKNTLPHSLIKRLSEGSFILILTSALFVLLSLVTYKGSDPGWSHVSHTKSISNSGGQVGSYIADALFFVFGYLAYLIPLGVAYIAWIILNDHRRLKTINQLILFLRCAGLLLLTSGGCGLLSLESQIKPLNELHSAGGALGQNMSLILSHAFNFQGAALILSAMFLVGVTWLTGLSWVLLVEWIGWSCLQGVKGVIRGLRALLSAIWLMTERFKMRGKNVPAIRTKRIRKPDMTKKTSGSLLSRVSKESMPELKNEPEKKAFKKMAVSGVMPKLSLLDKGTPGKPMGGYTHQELETLSRELEQHLIDFGIQADVVAVHPGPVITRFELQLAAGVKVSKLTTLAKDLARSMSVVSMRVVEVIQGKTVVGLELPNQEREIVRLSDVLSADVYQQAHSPLTMALGVDIAGYPMVVDLAKMPHLLVAGTTGSGKSVGINAMILSLLFKSSPEQVRLIMIDPKMLELSVYDGIPHLLTPVVTDMKEAASALRWCVGEMERRYRLMAALGVRNLAGFNGKVTDAIAQGEPLADPLWKAGQSTGETAPSLDKLPYVVVIIDELADMMMVVGKKVEQLIARIAQKARAAGIHLILATQRPSVDVLTGLIKSNIPTRMSFQVSSKIDSRTILDQQGAEQLLGHGDMLYLPPGSGAPLRVHGAFVDDKEVHRVADDWRARGEPDYIEEITQVHSDGFDADFGEEGQAVEEVDVLYDQAVEFVIQSRKASISAVQRRLKVGYNRAARLVEEMERTGIVGPLEGGFRDVLVSSATEE